MRPWLAGGRAARARQTVPAAVVLAVVAALLGWWLSRPATAAKAASGPGGYVLGLHDYYFSPSHLTWRVGEQVTLTVVNESDPGVIHEFMMGHDPRRYATLLGTRQLDGFVHDFFTGMTVWFGDAKGVDVLMPGKAHLTGSEASKYYMRMPASSMGGGSPAMSATAAPSPTMSASRDSASTASPSPSMSMASPSPSMSMASPGKPMIMKGNGLMIDLVPGGHATIRFTVPDRPGTWTFGCFVQSGQHFLNGMRGTVTIVR